MPQVHAPVSFSAGIQKNDANAPGPVFHGNLGPGDLGELFPSSVSAGLRKQATTSSGDFVLVLGCYLFV